MFDPSPYFASHLLRTWLLSVVCGLDSNSRLSSRLWVNNHVRRIEFRTVWRRKQHAAAPFPAIARLSFGEFRKKWSI